MHVPDAPARRIEVSRGHIDLAPTIAELMGLREKGDFRGVSLVPELFGAEAKPRPVLAALPRCDLMDRRRAYIDGDYKLLSFGDEASFQMYDVNKDFLEEHDLSTTHPDKFARMKQDYLAFVEQIPNVNVVGPAVLKGAPPGRRW
jgi:arylsulfatase A-like enzyme